MSRLRRRDDEGATALEFALVVPVFLALVGGMLTLGLRMTYSAIAQHAVREGLRAATVTDAQGRYASQSDVQAEVDDSAKGLLSTSEPVLVEIQSGDGGLRQGDPVRVTVVYEVGVVSAAAQVLPFGLGRGALENLARIEATAEGRLE